MGSIDWLNYHENTPIDFKDTHIFKFSIRLYDDIEQLHLSVLNHDELNKARNFRQKADAKRYIIGKFFTRLIAGKKLSVHPNEVIFSETNNHKPSTVNFNFNISHSGNFVILAISPFPIGIDIEFINPDFNYSGLLDQCFKPSELKLINDRIGFYSIWTRKEAILKATGEGLIDDLHDIDCSTDIVRRNNSSYNLFNQQIEKEYMLSIASISDTSTYKYWNCLYYPGL